MPDAERSVQQEGGPVLVSCQSLQGTQITGGQAIEVECFITVGGTQSFQGVQLDFPCSLTNGSAGALTAVDLEVESGHVPPFLFEPARIRVVNPSRCAMLGSVSLAHSPTTPEAGTYYLATMSYDVGECADGTYTLPFESAGDPPHPCDQTKMRDADRNLIPFGITPLSFAASPPPYGDVLRTGAVDIGDILLMLDAFSGLVICPQCDIDPCAGNSFFDVGDILAMLGAFEGNFA